MTSPPRVRIHWLAVLLLLATEPRPLSWAEPTRQEIREAISALASVRESASGADRAIAALFDETAGHALREELERGLTQLLLSDAHPASKQKTCAFLGRFGTETSLPVLGQLLVEHNATKMVAATLRDHPAHAAGKVLTSGLDRISGVRSLPVIAALGARRERGAVAALAKLAHGQERDVATAAAHALGRIATAPAIRVLNLQRCRPSAVRCEKATRALLTAARECLARGRRSEATSIYRVLAAEPRAPTGVRRSARAGLRELEASKEMNYDFKSAEPVLLFDGKTLAGWEGNSEFFRVEDGAIVGGSLERRIPRNEFLCTERVFGDFELRLKVKLVGKGDNAGIQFRSLRVPSHHEVSGYQADMGTGWWGLLYDESRRNRPLCVPNSEALERVLRPDDWNDYVIRCLGPRIQLELNGMRTVDYVEQEPEIRRRGILGLQIHSGAPSQAYYKDIVLRELPAK